MISSQGHCHEPPTNGRIKGESLITISCSIIFAALWEKYEFIQRSPLISRAKHRCSGLPDNTHFLTLTGTYTRITKKKLKLIRMFPIIEIGEITDREEKRQILDLPVWFHKKPGSRV